MKGSSCFLCEGLVETDNEECLCNDCLKEIHGTTVIRHVVILAVIIVTAIMMMSIF